MKNKQMTCGFKIPTRRRQNLEKREALKQSMLRNSFLR